MFKNPFSFEGRIRRTEYGLTLIIYVVLTTIISTIIEESRGDADMLGLALIPMIWIVWAQGAKRCHDVGNSGWWQLIPFYNLWLIFQDGQLGSNEYGKNPKGMVGSTNYGQDAPVNTRSGYQGNYSGGHNNQNNNYNQTTEVKNRDSYKDGDLYN